MTTALHARSVLSAAAGARRQNSTEKSRDGGDGAFPDAAHTPSASAVSQVRAGCKSLVDSSSRFRPLAMPRRGARLLAGRAARRTAARSMVVAELRLAARRRRRLSTRQCRSQPMSSIKMRRASPRYPVGGDGSRGAREPGPASPPARPFCRVRRGAGTRPRGVAGAAPRVRRRTGDDQETADELARRRPLFVLRELG